MVNNLRAQNEVVISELYGPYCVGISIRNRECLNIKSTHDDIRSCPMCTLMVRR